MGSFTDANIEAGLDARTNATEYLSAHTAFSTTGTNEVTGGAYARKLMGWDAATGRIADNTDAETLDIPAATTVRWLGRWSAVTVGTFYGMVPNGSTKGLVCVVKSGDNTVHAAAHAFVLNDTVTFLAVDGTVPTGITEGTVYHVIGTPNTDDFQVSATQGGAALSITATAGCIVSDITEEVFGGAGTLDLAAGDFDLKGIA